MCGYGHEQGMNSTLHRDTLLYTLLYTRFCTHLCYVGAESEDQLGVGGEEHNTGTSEEGIELERRHKHFSKRLFVLEIRTPEDLPQRKTCEVCGARHGVV